MSVLVCAWGNKYGLPPEADFWFVLTGLQNPHRIKSLRYLSGHDAEVRANVWSCPRANERYARYKQKVCEFIREGQDCTVIFVCHGGRHRSVTFALRLTQELRWMGVEVECDSPWAKAKEA